MMSSVSDGSSSPGANDGVDVHKSREGDADDSLSSVYHPLQCLFSMTLQCAPQCYTGKVTIAQEHVKVRLVRFIWLLI